MPRDKVRLYGLNAINNMDKNVVISGFVKALILRAGGKYVCRGFDLISRRISNRG